MGLRSLSSSSSKTCVQITNNVTSFVTFHCGRLSKMPGGLHILSLSSVLCWCGFHEQGNNCLRHGCVPYSMALQHIPYRKSLSFAVLHHIFIYLIFYHPCIYYKIWIVYFPTENAYMVYGRFHNQTQTNIHIQTYTERERTERERGREREKGREVFIWHMYKWKEKLIFWWKENMSGNKLESSIPYSKMKM